MKRKYDIAYVNRDNWMTDAIKNGVRQFVYFIFLSTK